MWRATRSPGATPAAIRPRARRVAEVSHSRKVSDPLPTTVYAVSSPKASAMACSCSDGSPATTSDPFVGRAPGTPSDGGTSLDGQGVVGLGLGIGPGRPVDVDDHVVEPSGEA